MKTTYDLQYSKLDWLVMFAIFMFPVTFLTLRHGVHISLFAIFLMAICQFWRIGIKKIQFDYPQDFFILFIFSGLFFSVLLSQIFRGEIDFAAFDGPSRILLSGVVFMFLRQSNISTIKILAIAIPAGLICTFLELRLNSSSHWGVRYAIYFVDPNTLGSQAFILALLSFVMTSIVRKKISPLLLLQIIGGLVGLFISIGSSSRGGWLAVPFIFILMFVIR
jgi:O-antigen ligase